MGRSVECGLDRALQRGSFASKNAVQGEGYLAVAARFTWGRKKQLTGRKKGVS
jgi:hypothetical protein